MNTKTPPQRIQSKYIARDPALISAAKALVDTWGESRGWTRARFAHSVVSAQTHWVVTTKVWWSRHEDPTMVLADAVTYEVSPQLRLDFVLMALEAETRRQAEGTT